MVTHAGAMKYLALKNIPWDTDFGGASPASQLGLPAGWTLSGCCKPFQEGEGIRAHHVA